MNWLWTLIVWTAYSPHAEVKWTTLDYNSQIACEQFRAELIHNYELISEVDSDFSWGVGECTSEH
jgi:hypothetical protein